MKISKLLTNWYNTHARDLPWRHTKDPYKIWISEIILQQTRIAQGTEYYLNFIKIFPDIKSLAEASEVDVLKLWEGLGYYSRARNLHASAKYIMEELNGNFPDNFKGISSLKGVGSYTAGAIASIAFNLPYHAIDGNVKRIISRIFGIKEDVNSRIGIQQIESSLNKIMDEKEPGKFNQALMDVGSMICTPKNPDCANCILISKCVAYKSNVVNDLPITYKKIKIRKRFFIYFLILQESNVLIRRRKEEDIWKGLFEFPLMEFKIMPEKEKWLIEFKKTFHLNNPSIEVSKISPIFKHNLSHQKIEAQFIHIKISDLKEFSNKFDLNLVAIKNLKTFPFPRLTEKYIIDHLTEYQ